MTAMNPTEGNGEIQASSCGFADLRETESNGEEELRSSQYSGD